MQSPPRTLLPVSSLASRIQALTEALSLTAPDSAALVPSTAQKRERPAPAPEAAPLEEIGEGAMDAARALLAAEAVVVRRAMGHEGVPDEEYAEAAAQLQRDFIFVPARGAYDRANSATNSDRLASIQV